MELSPIKRSALAIIDSFRDIVANDCDDADIVKTIPNINIPIDVGIKEKDYMSYDDAIDFLKIGYNRNRLSELAKKHGIKSHKFRKMPIGFHIKDIERLKTILDSEKNTL